jgi:CDP-glycerol glycerophosphotransferase
MNNKKNILITQIHMAVGGIETVLLNLLNTLDKEKYNIDLVLYYPRGEFIDKIPNWVNVIPVWNETKHKDFWKDIIMSRNVVKRVLKNLLVNNLTIKHFVSNKQYDVSISFSGYHIFSNAFAAKSNAKKKLIWVHTDFAKQFEIREEFKKQFKKIYKQYKYFDKIVCVSKSVCDEFKKFKPELSDKLDYCWNIIKKREYPDTNENIQLQNGFNCITASRLVKTKGIEKLIDIAKMIKRDNLNCHLYVAGDGPLRLWAEEQIKENDLKNTITLLGNVINLISVFKQCNLYISPSDLEGLPTVILESLLEGVPVIATPIAGSIDIFEYMAPPNSMLLSKDSTSESIYESLKTVLDKPLKPFKIDIDAINSETLNKFESLLEN